MYPSCSKRMLRIVDTQPEMTKFASGSSVEVLYENVHLEYRWYCMKCKWCRYC